MLCFVAMPELHHILAQLPLQHDIAVPWLQDVAHTQTLQPMQEQQQRRLQIRKALLEATCGSPI